MAKNRRIENALYFEPWENMQQRLTFDEDESAKNKDTQKNRATTTAEQSALLELSPEAKILGLDSVFRIPYQFTERQKWINLSARQIEKAKKELLNKQFIHEVSLGKSLFIAPTEELFSLFGMKSPYKRNTWEIHSFLVLLAEKLIEFDPLVKHVRTEVSIGDANSTIDVVSTAKNGQRWAWEVTHHCKKNVSANAAKLQDKGFSQIMFLCADYNIKQAVWSQLRNAGFDPDFFAQIRCTIFSALINKRKNSKLRGT